MSDRRDVTGVWYGRWTSSDPYVRPNSFIATLEEHASIVSGAITERGEGGLERADVDGVRAGGRIEFHKQYDGSGRLAHSVAYVGTINGAGTAIVGTWRLGSGHSGAFTMNREKFDADELDREEIAETRIPARVD